MPAPKEIHSLGECHVRAHSKQGVYEQMEQFLDESPSMRALTRQVRRSTKAQRQEMGFDWWGVLRWERRLVVAPRKHA